MYVPQWTNYTRKAFFVLVPLLLLFLSWGCGGGGGGTLSTNIPTTVVAGGQIFTNLPVTPGVSVAPHGQISPNWLPLVGATITLLGQETTTDENGFYQFTLDETTFSWAQPQVLNLSINSVSTGNSFVRINVTPNQTNLLKLKIPFDAPTIPSLTLSTIAIEKTLPSLTTANNLTLLKQVIEEEITAVENGATPLVSTATLRGQINQEGVSFLLDGLPISNTASTTNPWVKLTSIAGSTSFSFEIEQIPAGIHTLEIERVGFTSTQQTLTLFGGLSTTNLDFILSPLSNLGILTSTIISGNSQFGLENLPLPLPLVVQVNDGNGQGVAGITVVFSVLTGGGNLDVNGQTTTIETSTVTNNQGQARCDRWIPGSALTSQQTVRAFIADASPNQLDFTAIITQPGSDQLLLSASTPSAEVSQTISLTATLTNSDNQPIAGETLNFSLTTQPALKGIQTGAVLSTLTVTTDDTGRATTLLTLSESKGFHQVKVEQTTRGLVSTIPLQALAGNPTTMSFIPPLPGTITVGSFHPLSVTVLDQFGNFVEDGIPVIFSLAKTPTTSSALLTKQTDLTTAGLATSWLQTGTSSSESYIITATLDSLTTNSAPISTEANNAASFSFTHQTDGTAGTPFVISNLTALDSFGNRDYSYGGVRALTLTSVNDSPNSTSPTITTNATFVSGVATTPIQVSLYKAENTRITINEGLISGSGPIISVAAAIPTSISFTSLPSSTISTDQSILTLQLSAFDDYGNLTAAGYTASLSLTDPAPSNTTNFSVISQVTLTHGTAAVNLNLSTTTGDNIQLTADLLGLSTSTGILTMVAGQPASLELLLPATTTAGTTFQAIDCHLKDQHGNLANQFSGIETITWLGVASSPNGTPPTLPSSISFTSGIANPLPQLTLTESGSFSVSAISSPGTATNTLTVIPDVVNQLSTTPTSTSTIAADQSSKTIEATVMDSFGNPVVDGTIVNFTLLDPMPANLGSASLTLNSATTLAGIATTSLTTSSILGDDYQILASSNGISNQSATLTVSNLTADHFDVTLPATGIAGTSLTNVKITARDSANMIVTAFSGTKTLTFSGPAAAPGGQTPDYPTAVTFVDGQATINTITLKKAESTPLSVSWLTISGSSSALTITPGSPAAIAITPTLPTVISADSPAQGITATITDSFGNLVSDGTVIDLSVTDPNGDNTGTAAAIAANSATTSGQISVTVTTSTTSGDDYQITASHGVVSATTAILSVTHGTLDHFDMGLPATITAGVATNFLNLSARDSHNNLVRSWHGTKNPVFSGPGAAPNGNTPVYPASVTFVNGSANPLPSITLYKSETNLDVIITDSGKMGSATALTVLPSIFQKIRLIATPSANYALSVLTPNSQLEVTDNFENRISSDNSTIITAAIQDNPSAGALSGTLAKAVIAGQLTFDDLQISQPGSGYTLKFTAGSIFAITPSFTLTTKPATIIQVETTVANGSYNPSSVIDITVKFSEPVTVNTSGGVPRILLNSGGIALYLSGSATNTLLFRYTVQNGENVSILDTVDANSLILNGGTIRNAALVDSTLTIPSPTLSNTHQITIDSIVPTQPSAPTITTASGTIVNNYMNGTNTGFTASATITAGTATNGHAELLYNGAPFTPAIIDNSIGTTETTITFSSNTITTGELQTLIPVSGVFSVRLFDAAGNSTSSATGVNITVDYTPPTAPLGVILATSGGTIRTNTINNTNTKLSISATITAGVATDGTAELLIGGVLSAQTISDTTISSTDTTVTMASSTTTPTELQHAILTGGVAAIRLYDRAGNSSTSTVANPTLIVDYLNPTLLTIPLLNQSGGIIVTNRLNATNTSLTVTAGITGTDMNGGIAELLLNGNSFIPAITDSSIGSGDTSLFFDFGVATALLLQARILEGTHQLSVKLVDAAGNTFISPLTLQITADYTKPAIPSGPVFTATNGIVNTNFLNTTNTGFSITSTMTADTAIGGIAELLVDGVSFVPPIYDSAILTGETDLTFTSGTTTNAALQLLIPSGGVLSVSLTDVSGNQVVSTSSNPTISVDYNLPTPATSLVFTPQSGTVLPLILNSTNTSFLVSATIVAGEVTGGTAELLLDGASFSPPLLDTTIAGGDTTITFNPGLAANVTLQSLINEGTHILTTRLTDAADNSVNSLALDDLSITASYIRPAVPVTNSPIIPANLGGHGNSADHINRNLRDNFGDFGVMVGNTGTGNKSGLLYITINDDDSPVNSWTTAGIPVVAGEAVSLRNSFPAGTIAGFQDGKISLTMWIVDATGNVSNLLKASFTQGLDTTIPAAPAILTPAISANLGGQKNTVDHINLRLRNSIDDLKIAIANTPAGNETGILSLSISDGVMTTNSADVAITTNQTASFGSFALGSINGLVDGNITITAQIKDAAGNVSAPDTQIVANALDTQVPTLTVNPQITTDTTPALTGTVDDASVVIKVVINGNIYTATNHGATWSLADGAISPALSLGTWDVVVMSDDDAGNRGYDATVNELTVQ